MGDTLAAYAREVVEPYRRTVANEVAALVAARARIEEDEQGGRKGHCLGCGKDLVMGSCPSDCPSKPKERKRDERHR